MWRCGGGGVDVAGVPWGPDWAKGRRGFLLLGLRDRSAGDTRGMSDGIWRGLCLEEVRVMDFFCCALVGRFILKIAV